MSKLSTLQSREQEDFGAYVLMTAAHNEEAFIEGTIQTVLAQTFRPVRWVIVNDNSTDRTQEILESYARQYDFIRVMRIKRIPGRNFASKVLALKQGTKLLEDVKYDFIGNADADVLLEPTYFEELIRHFLRNADLGLAAGFLYEESAGEYRSVWINEITNVFHAAQLVRRRCYEEIGGYAVLKYGGEDWYAQIQARMKGWQVEAFPSLKIFHLRHTTGGSSPLRNAFRQGRLDYSFGSHPLFELTKCLRRIKERPYLACALARLSGFAWSHISQEPRAVRDDFARFLRTEQKNRLLNLLSRGRSVATTAIIRSEVTHQ